MEKFLSVTKHSSSVSKEIKSRKKKRWFYYGVYMNIMILRCYVIFRFLLCRLGKSFLKLICGQVLYFLFTNWYKHGHRLENNKYAQGANLEFYPYLGILTDMICSQHIPETTLWCDGNKCYLADKYLTITSEAVCYPACPAGDSPGGDICLRYTREPYHSICITKQPRVIKWR